MGLCFQRLFRALSYCQQNEEEKEKDSDVNLITDTHNHALLNNSEAVHGNKMILRSYCSLGTPHRGRARKALRASWGPNTTVSTHNRTIYAHTHAQAHMAWRRVDSQRGPDTITSLQRHHCHCGGSHLHPGAEALAPRPVHRIPSL